MSWGRVIHLLLTAALLMAVVIFGCMNFAQQSQVNQLKRTNHQQEASLAKLRRDGQGQLDWNSAMFQWSKIVTRTVLAPSTTASRSLAGR